MKKTVTTFAKAKASGEKLTMLTAYDYSTAKLMDEAGVDSILVGDSLGNVVLGYEDTVSVTMEDMIHHGAAVARGAKEALVVIDMPFMSYQTSVYDAVVNECVPEKLATLVTEKLDIPTIGIGAGNGCDGQVLVYADMLGMFSDFTPKFVKRFAEIGPQMTDGFKAYIKEVKDGTYPSAEHTYAIADDVIEKLY